MRIVKPTFDEHGHVLIGKVPVRGVSNFFATQLLARKHVDGIAAGEVDDASNNGRQREHATDDLQNFDI